MTITRAARHDRCDVLQADRMTLAGATSKVLIGQPKGPQEPPLRSFCGPACREQPGTGENSRRQAPAFTRVFPRVPGCARSTNVSGRQDLNLRPPGPQPGALPDCATPRGAFRFYGQRPRGTCPTRSGP